MITLRSGRIVPRVAVSPPRAPAAPARVARPAVPPATLPPAPPPTTSPPVFAAPPTSAHASAMALANAASAEVAAIGREAVNALANLAPASPLDVALRARTTSTLPKEVPGVLRARDGRIVFYPADVNVQPADVDARVVERLPTDVVVLAKGKRHAPHEEPLFGLKRDDRRVRPRFVGRVSVIDGQPFVSDGFAKSCGGYLPLADSAAPWTAGSVVDVHVEGAGPAARAVVDDVIAGGESARARIYGIAAELGLDPTHPARARAETERLVLDAGVDDRALVDLTRKPFFAIDNDDAHDIDQAMCLEREPGGYLLSYALADASHFIRPGMALHEEALQRGASYYLPGVSIPMLPRVLSEGVVSLNAGEDRRALVLEIHLDDDAEPLRTEVRRAKIHSHDQLTYQGVSAHLEGAATLTPNHPGVSEGLQLFGEVGAKRQAAALRRGVVQPERVNLGVEVTDAELLPRASASTLADRYNAEISILANVEGALLLKRPRVDGIEVPGIYRAHDRPHDGKLRALRYQVHVIVDRHGLDDVWRWKRDEPAARYVERLRTLPTNARELELSRTLQTQMVIVNSASEYRRAADPHSGLEVEAYGRFTAPMREAVGIVSHAALFELARLERIHDANPHMSAAQVQAVWTHQRLALLNPARLTPAQREVQAMLAALDAETPSTFPRAARALVRHIVRMEPVEPSLQAEVERQFDLAVSRGNASRAAQKQADRACRKLLLDEVLERDLAAGAPLRRAVVQSVSPARLDVELADPALALRIPVRDLERSTGRAWRLDADSVGLVPRDDDDGRALSVGQEMALRATRDEQGRAYFAWVASNA